MKRSLLMIHGVGCGGEVWDTMRPIFEARGWICHAPTLFEDQRTIDAPPLSLPELRLKDYVAASGEAACKIEAETGDRPVVLGHSMGGLIAQKLVELGAARAGVFLTPAQTADCQSPSPAVIFTFANIAFTPPAKMTAKSFKVWKTGFHWGVLNAVPHADRAKIYANARYDSGGVFADLSAPDDAVDDAGRVDLSRIVVPTLTIGAAKDRATTAKAVRKVGAKYARAPKPGCYKEYADNGHWILGEPGADRVASDIADWLEQEAPALV
ncbi:MAG: alpha/beta hydrolase [Pseudomonadota bacterium]